MAAVAVAKVVAKAVAIDADVAYVLVWLRMAFAPFLFQAQFFISLVLFFLHRDYDGNFEA